MVWRNLNMFKNKSENKILLVILFLSLTIFGVAHFLHAAWQAPAGEPYSGNDSFPFIPNAANDDNNYVFDKPLGIDSNFIVGANTLYVNETASRVGVLTNNPQTALDVWGVMRIGQMHAIDFPPCNSTIEGSMVYNLDQNRLNLCVNDNWRRVGYDGDLDGWLDYVDCNDNDPTRAVEVCGDTIDNSCDGRINEGCTCTANDWLPVSCPSMVGCINNTTVTAAKLPGSQCSGTAPVTTCNCVCRTEHFVPPLPPVCPDCRASAVTLYSALVSGVTCVDSNSLSDTYCSDNCTGYCNGITCCNQSTYYSCSGNYRVFHDACGATSQTYCTYGCSGGSCQEDPCAVPSNQAECEACGGYWNEWYVDEHNYGAQCISAH